MTVELLPHDPAWALAAEVEGRVLRSAIGPGLLAVHHIGSTSIPAIAAKPILDLLGLARSFAELDECRPRFEALGYEWMGEFSLPGRRYCRKDDPETGLRLVQLQCYEAGSAGIDRLLAFRDHLRRNRVIAEAYLLVKMRCRDLHPEDVHAYSSCKSDWIKAMEIEALITQRLDLGWHQSRCPKGGPPGSLGKLSSSTTQGALEPVM